MGLHAAYYAAFTSLEQGRKGCICGKRHHHLTAAFACARNTPGALFSRFWYGELDAISRDVWAVQRLEAANPGQATSRYACTFDWA